MDPVAVILLGEHAQSPEVTVIIEWTAKIGADIAVGRIVHQLLG